jgi:hypothetical protein
MISPDSTTKYYESKDVVAFRIDQGFHEPAHLGKSSGAQHRHHRYLHRHHRYLDQPTGYPSFLRIRFVEATRANST